MGCGESKHQIVADNTVRSSSKRTGSKKGGEALPSENLTGDGNVNLTVNSEPASDKPNTNSAVEEKVNEKANQIMNEEKLKSADDEKLKVVEEEKKKDDKQEDVIEEKEKLKSREEKESVEIINSGKSESYYSPLAKDAGADGVDANASKSNHVPLQQNQTLTQNEGGGKVEEEIPVKEEKVSTTTMVVEEKASTTADEQIQVPTATKEELGIEKPTEDDMKAKSKE